MDWLAALLVPALLGFGGLVGFAVKSRMEEQQRAREGLASERRKIYADLLDPYIRIFALAKDKGDTGDIEKHILSSEYRKTALEVVLVGSDEAVDAYNDLMQTYFKGISSSTSSQIEALGRYGHLLLAIRKSLGHGATQLDEWDMLRHMITDLDEVVAKAGIQRKRRRSPRTSP